MKIQQRFANALALLLAVGAPIAAQASTFSFNPGGSTGPTVYNVTSIDQAPGNAYAAGGITAIQNFLNGTGDTSFTLYYQANLNSLLSGNQNAFSNGTGGKYFTFIAGFGETVKGASLDLGVAKFALDTSIGQPNYFKIYASSAPGNDQTGKGFADGNVILSGHVTSEGPSVFNVEDTTTFLRADKLGSTYTNTGSGILKDQMTRTGGGSTALTVAVDTFDQSYFPNFDSNAAFSTDFFTGAGIPFSSIFPSECINTADRNCTTNSGITTVGTLGTVNGAFDGNARSFLFSADANETLSGTVIPEPASLAILGLGLAMIGFATVAGKKKQG